MWGKPFQKGVLSSPKPIKKGQHLSPTTEFKKGLIPENKLPIGSLTKRIHKGDHPRFWRKVAEPNVWIPNSVFVWVERGGSVPKGFTLHHIDKNTLNDLLENLSLMTREAHRNIHHVDLMKGRIGLKLKQKKLLCGSCEKEIQAKKIGTLCTECRKGQRKNASSAYKQRIRDRNRPERTSVNS